MAGIIAALSAGRDTIKHAFDSHAGREIVRAQSGHRNRSR